MTEPTNTPGSLVNSRNAHQAAAWNGYEGRHWADRQDRYDAINDGANSPLLDAAAIAPTDRVLDIGCGNGRVTRLAAGLAASAVGIDLSAPMLERARASAAAESLDNVDFVQADAQVYPFEAGAFDVAVSRFGVMFFADPVEGFRNIGRALRPGGRLAFVCPQSFDRMDQSTIFEAIGKHVRLPDLSQATGPSPLAFADPDHTRRVLTAAGFDDITIEGIDRPQYWGKDAEDAADFLFGFGPLRHWLSEAHADSATEERAHRAATDAFRTYRTDSGVRLLGRYWLVSGRSTPRPTGITGTIE
ncbi:class I SAM-dependent methyltransferase [Streptomyces ipomoeae]|uniref:class I SAM-dependent methyltransferase n=1 Tax=Streptomyces ipomoeae TaxID=103232 RepID=UPI001147A0DB|nr:class I SAM-dependent methyltransferase [Streptomyces ipomoeae]MDX2937277.1 class I SAM-dependent methyltransferase [Streptomyces ipomoeae]TQE27207.1 class I SAM-dependent methyltransferase [Streptomyces ipomoeae]